MKNGAQVVVIPGDICPAVNDEYYPENRPYLGKLYRANQKERNAYNCIIDLDNGKRLLLRPGEYHIVKGDIYV